MPWTVKDVDKHKKGLSTEQKKKWVRVANKVLKDCLKDGGSQKSCEAKAIRTANSKFSERGGDSMTLNGKTGNLKVPKTALHLYDADHTSVQLKAGEDGAPPEVKILAYSGKPFKHFWWGNFAIDLSGITPAKNKIPLLRDHRTDFELGYFSKPKIDDTGVNVLPETVTLLDNEEAGKFVQNSKAGFPYEASIYAVPTKIRRVSEKEEVEVNGHKLRGPGTIFEKTKLKEVSVCVFGYDSNTKSAAMEDSADSVTLSVECENEDNYEEVNGTMKLSELKKKDPEGYAQLVEEAKGSVSEEFNTKLSEKDDQIKELEKDNLKLSEEKTKLEEDHKSLSIRLTKLEEKDIEREILASAETIISAAFSETTLSARAKKKVRKYLDHSKFVSDDGLDKEAFSKFVKDELKDWETTLTPSEEDDEVLGNGQSKRDVDSNTTLTEDKEAEDITDRMLMSIGQKSEKNE